MEILLYTQAVGLGLDWSLPRLLHGRGDYAAGGHGQLLLELERVVHLRQSGGQD